MYLFKVALNTNGKGLWSKVAKKVRCLQMDMAYLNDEEDFGELRIYFDPKSWNVRKDGLIYTDPLFLKELHVALKALGLPAKRTTVYYSEQGMQGANYVSLDIEGEFIQSYLEREK